MSEEMIVNGVDISECGFLDYHRPTKLLLCNECNSNFEAMECKDYHDCYYKQMKRLEQENAKLKEENFKLGQIDIKKVTLVENRQLEAGNAKLKEALENVRSYLKLTGVLWDNELLLDTNTQRAVDVINEVLKDD